MSLSPLFTDAELAAQVAAYKKALTALAAAQTYELELDGERHRLTRADLPEIRTTLEWLQAQRAGNAVGAGPQILTGRPRR